MDVEQERREIRNFVRELRLFFPDLFSADARVHVTRAPGRLDVMGGIADYSGSLVLELPLDLATFVAVQPRDDGRVVIESWNARSEDWIPKVDVELRKLWQGGEPIGYAQFREEWGKDPALRWVRYVLGCPLVLARQRLISPEVCGANVGIRSTVPLGAGVSSSASLEVASLAAFCALWDVTLEPLEMALLAQEVENYAVGAPCGVMDQVTATLGKKDQLIAILCQPAELMGYIPVPPDFTFWGVDTGVRHSVGGERYTTTRVATFMGKKIISRLRLQQGQPGIPGGYLCNITPKEYVQRYRDHLPLRIRGREFLQLYGDIDDPVTSVVPEVIYAVRSRTEHPIRENHRVRQFVRLLEELARGGREELALKAGQLMYASHWSYSKLCGLGAREADFLVRAVRSAGKEKGFYGAKITGGGSGGTVAVFAKRHAEKPLRRIVDRYAAWSGLQPKTFWGSSSGAAWVGPVRA